MFSFFYMWLETRIVINIDYVYTGNEYLIALDSGT